MPARSPLLVPGRLPGGTQGESGAAGSRAAARRAGRAGCSGTTWMTGPVGFAEWSANTRAGSQQPSRMFDDCDSGEISSAAAQPVRTGSK